MGSNHFELDILMGSTYFAFIIKLGSIKLGTSMGSTYFAFITKLDGINCLQVSVRTLPSHRTLFSFGIENYYVLMPRSMGNVPFIFRTKDVEFHISSILPSSLSRSVMIPKANCRGVSHEYELRLCIGSISGYASYFMDVGLLWRILFVTRCIGIRYLTTRHHF